jgi:transcriptional regulator with GAF, ATPase, and Fis domain
VAELAAPFVGTRGLEVVAGIDQALRRVGEFFEADVARLGYLTLDGKVLPTAQGWFSDRYDADELVRHLFARTYPDLANGLVERGCLVCSCVDDFSEWGGEAELTFVRDAGIKASVMVSLGVREGVLEALAIDMMRSERLWSEDEVACAQLIGRVLSDAARRASAEAALEEQARELREALAETDRLRERLEAENLYLREETGKTGRYPGIVGESQVFRAVLRQVEQVADTDATVLLQGETGVGKDVVAQLIHERSSRSGGLLVKLNCAALPSTLVESELFGREKGAYTGALSRYVGRFELADGATILLDEVSELPLELQAKLLRVLHDGEFEPLGSTKTLKVDARVIAATNRDLTRAVQTGQFRENLFYRLNVFPITVPPLRERREDVPLLVWAFVKELCKKLGKKIDSISRKSMDELQRYPWPGNIRELRNVIERAMIVTESSTLQVQLPHTAPTAAADLSMDEMQRRHILAVLEQAGGRVRGKHGAAELLGMKPTTLDNRMKKLGVKRSEQGSR